ncbi:DUF2637 domain-containing protein [Streptomyces sp. DG2A-72]|uniref:DUF2637 domain-containing protein n=1 Tax=Streptomyces sp. DG2A-72 TaxID=3051386 RepID=UPI00265BE333|nr:DUF2637 domain-containing protein [Streptomyces sp. DG2A-72]MDO0934144.1 DUF2637 domain-containing protein [Streptomyces sp. DG2A-72]
MASVAAYASYVHQRDFALQGGTDATSAALWPLSVDGLLLLATVGLLKPAEHAGRRARSVVWMAFLLGIGVSLAANVAAAPDLAWKPVLVAGWPPVALLFSVELLAHRSGDRERTETGRENRPPVSSRSHGRAHRKPSETGSLHHSETLGAGARARPATLALPQSRHPRLGRTLRRSCGSTSSNSGPSAERRQARSWTEWLAPTTTVELSSRAGGEQAASLPRQRRHRQTGSSP